MARLRVAVLMGGVSSERAISLSTGNQIVSALDPGKYDVFAMDAAALFPAGSLAAGPHPPTSADSETGALVKASLAELSNPSAAGRPDIVFIALHGKGGEDGTVQAILDTLGIPYTGSGMLASAIAMDKAMTKRLLRAEGIPTPKEVIVKRGGSLPEALDEVASALGIPVIVKPNTGGSTIGCEIVYSAQFLEPAIVEAMRHDAVVLVEELIQGVEITVGLLGGDDPQPLPIIEIVAESGFYDYEAKYAPGGSRHIIPAHISPRAAELATSYAAACHRILGCKGMSRVDMIVAGDVPHVLEINTIPGMTPTSLLPEAAAAAGIAFPQLLDRIIDCALQAES